MAEYFDDDEIESICYTEEQRRKIQKEKEYWNKYGTKIFEYSYNTHKCNLGNFGSPVQNLIPTNILNDYLSTRQRNFNINKIYLNFK